MKRDDDDPKKQPWKCCVCRGTHEHRCYMCFCEKCPSYLKKKKDQAAKVARINTSAKQQPVETSDPCAGDKNSLGVSSKSSNSRSTPPTGSGARADVAEDGKISPHPSSIVKEQRGNHEADKQKVGGPSSLLSGSESIWDAVAKKATIASGNQLGWASKSAAASSWSTRPWNDARDIAAEPIASWKANQCNKPRGDAARSSISKGTGHGNERRGIWHEDERRDDATRSTSSNDTRPSHEKRRHAAGFIQNREACIVEPRGNRESWISGIEDLPSKQAKRPRGPQENATNTTKDSSAETVLLKPHVDSGSCQASVPLKESRGYAEITTNRFEDGPGQALDNEDAQPGSSQDVLAVKELRGNVEVTRGRRRKFKEWVQIFGNVEATTDKAADGSGEVPYNHLISSTSSWDASKLKELGGNHGITALSNSDAVFISTPSLTEKQATVSEEMDKDGQGKVTIPPNKLEGIVRVAKGLVYPRENYSTERKLRSPTNPAQVGPALESTWKGKFEVPNFPGEIISEAFSAHSAAIVSRKAYEFANQMAYRLKFEVQPRHAFWPKIFQEKCPDNRDVALYFYPNPDLRSRKKYEIVLKLLEREDLLLRSIVGGVELLVSSSRVLDTNFQRFEGSFYLWGVFCELGGKEVGSSTNILPTPHPEPAQAIPYSTSTLKKRTPPLQK